MTSVTVKTKEGATMRVKLVDRSDIPATVKVFSRAAADIMCNPKTGFYSALLMQVPVHWTRDIPTAGVDIKARMFINPDFIDTLESLGKVVFLIIHELEHLLRLHPQREANRDPDRWNKACDAPINAALVKDRIGSFIMGGVDMPEHAGHTADHVYNLLPAKKEEEDGDGGEGGQGGDNPGDDSGGDGGIGRDVFSKDLLEGGKMTASDVQAAEAHVKGVIAAAAQTARVAGSMSAEMQRRVDDILDVKTPWYEVLERFMTEVSQNDYSWARPNRRFASQGIVLPSLHSVAALGTAVLIRDVSGSISEDEHKGMVGHINAIGTRCMPSIMHVLDVSTEVHYNHEFEPSDFPISPEIHGRGGTDLTVGFDYINEKIEDVAICVVLTDGHTPWPNIPQDYPVIVVCTTDVDVEYGDEVVRYEKETG